MVDRAQVFDAADELFRRRETPSVRRVTALLPAGGSPNVVGPLLREWHKARGDEPAGERPEIVDRDYDDFLSRVWILARAEARRSLEAAGARTEAMDGRLVELETEAAERDAALDRFRRDLELKALDLADERAERRAAESRATELAGALSAERAARVAAEAAAATAAARPAGGRRSAKRTDPKRLASDADAPWEEFAGAAEAAIGKAGRALTTREIVDALEPGFRSSLLAALRGNQMNKVRQWLDRRAEAGEVFTRLDPAGRERSPRYATPALSAATLAERPE